VTYDAERDGPLRGGASNEDDEYLYGISPKQAARLAESILADDAAPSTTPLKPGHSSGVPQGYGKWGDLA
jgi:hypothetical protein